MCNNKNALELDVNNNIHKYIEIMSIWMPFNYVNDFVYIKCTEQQQKKKIVKFIIFLF